MPDAEDLLYVARQMVGLPNPSNGQLCRSVSTAYYALFHKIARTAAQRFVGQDGEHTAGYSLLYRSFDHRHMKLTCEALKRSSLTAKLKRTLGRETLGPDIRKFAIAFPFLQEARHHADYDPNASFRPSEVIELIDLAVIAIAAFDRADPIEQSDVLALLMVKSRD